MVSIYYVSVKIFFKWIYGKSTVMDSKIYVIDCSIVIFYWWNYDT